MKHVKKLMLFVAAFTTLFATSSRAQDLAGNWQGTLHAGTKDLRIIMALSKGDKDGYSGKMYSIDQTPQPFNTSTIKSEAGTVKFSVDLIGGSYEGKLSPDNKTIAGTWTQGALPCRWSWRAPLRKPHGKFLRLQSRKSRWRPMRNRRSMWRPSSRTLPAETVCKGSP